MLKTIRKMINKPIKLTLIGRESSSIEWVGGGIESKQSGMILILRGLDNSWLAVEWLHSGQLVIIPTTDVLCIASDIV